MRGTSVLASILVFTAVAIPANADCHLVIPQTSIRELPSSQFTGARSITWRDDRRLLIGTRGHGILEYDSVTGDTKPLVASGEIPSGIPDVEKLDTDGVTVVAFNRDRTDVAFDLTKNKMVHTRRAAVMRVMDLAVNDGKVALLGYSFAPRAGGNGPVWIGDVGAGWDEHQLLYDAGPKYDEYFRFAMAPHAGAVRFLDKDTVGFVLASEPGVFRYRVADGSPLPRLGNDMTDLVMPELPDLIQKYSTDVAARYSKVVNRAPTIDDLVSFRGSPAVVVRRWKTGTVYWELWFASAGATRKVRLDLTDSRVIGGHLRCDASSSSKLACLYGKQIQPGRPDQPHVVLFDISKAVKRCD